MSRGAPRANLFLLELVLDLFVFALCAAVCVGLLVRAHDLSRESGRLTQAVYLAQSAAEAARTGATLPEPPEGYEICHETKEADGVTSMEIRVLCQGRTVYTLETAWPCTPAGEATG